MVELRDRIESTRQTMQEVSSFLTAPDRTSMDEHRQRLMWVATELRTILDDAAKLPDQERTAIRIPIEGLQREVQLSRSLVLQAAGIFQAFDEPAEPGSILYTRSDWHDGARG